MNHQQLTDIADANSAFEAAADINKFFLEWINAHSVPNNIPSKIEFLDNGIAVPCFGYTAIAKPRIVITAEQGFMVEYVFLVKKGEVEEEVWRFYLTSEGEIVESANGNGHVCKFEGNKYVARNICGRVLLGALRSEVFAPHPRQD